MTWSILKFFVQIRLIYASVDLCNLEEGYEVHDYNFSILQFVQYRIHALAKGGLVLLCDTLYKTGHHIIIYP